MNVRKIVTIVEEIHSEGGRQLATRPESPSLRR